MISLGGGYSSGEAQRTDTRCVRSGINCFNPEDPQSERVYGVNGVHPTIGANSGGGQNRSGVCYALQGNAVDRGSRENGCGYSVNTSPTLNTHDKHAVCFQPCGDRDNPSISFGDKAYCIPANPMSDRQQAVCFQQNQREEVRNMGERSGALTSEPGIHNQNYVCYPNKARSLCARWDSSPCVDRGQNIVCYEGQNISTDSDKAFTLQAGRPDDHHIPAIVTFAPEGNYCGAYRKDDVSATLQTGYHYGGGGDGAIAVYDCRGNGDGRTVQTLTGDHNNRVTDYTTICCQNIVEKTEDNDE